MLKQDLLVVLNKSTATVTLIDPYAGEQVARVAVGQGPHEVAVSEDGSLAVVTNYGTADAPGDTLSVVDLRRREVVRTISLAPHQKPHGIVWLPAHHVLVTTEGSRSVLCVDVRVGEVDCVIEIDQDVSHMLTLAPRGERAYVTNIGSGTMTAIDLPTRSVIGHVKTGAGAEGIAVTPDGSDVWVTNREDDTVSIVDAASMVVTDTVRSASFPIRVEITPNGHYVLVSNARSGSLSVFNADSHTRIRTIDFTGLPAETEGRLFGDRFGDSPVPIGLEIEPGGYRAFVSQTNADVVAVIELQSWRVIDGFAAGKEPDGLAFAQAPATLSAR